MTNDQIIFNVIKRSKKDLSAYDILDKVQKTKKMQPMTVYRSLKNLINDGLVHKSNINKTYLACNHSHQKNHNTILAICKKCGISEELTAKLSFTQLQKDKVKKFDMNNFDTEIFTNCRTCS